MSKIPKYIFTNEIGDLYTDYKADIRSWIAAMAFSRTVEHRKFQNLMRIYYKCLEDPHVASQINRRYSVLTQSSFSLVDSEGKTDRDMTALLQKMWFNNLMIEFIKSLVLGYGYLQVTELDNEGHIKHIRPLERRFIDPDKETFSVTYDKNVNLTEGVYKKWVLSLRKYEPMDNIINSIVPLTLIKKYAISSMSEYADRFAMPLRICKTDLDNADKGERARSFMKATSASGFAVIDIDDDVEFIQAQQGGDMVYTNLINITNAEISKRILGSVVGENTYAGSRAKEEVGFHVAEFVSESDKKQFQYFADNNLIPFLVNLSPKYSGMKDLSFRFNKNMDNEALFDRVVKLSNYYDFDIDTLNDKFGLSIIGKKENANKTNTPKKSDN